VTPLISKEYSSLGVFEREYVQKWATPFRRTERKYSFVHSSITENTVH
jgi:hypothetical protein